MNEWLNPTFWPPWLPWSLAGVALLALTIVSGMFYCYRRQYAAIRSKEIGELLQQLIDTLPSPVFLREAAAPFRYIASNRAYATLLGQTPETLRGRTDAEIFGADHPYAKRAMNSEPDTSECGKDHESTETLIAPDGIPRYLRCNRGSIRYPDGSRVLFGIADDITELTEANRSEMKSRTILETLLDHIPVGVFLKDPDAGFRYVLWNKAMEKISGTPQSRVLGRSDDEVAVYPITSVNSREEERGIIRTGLPQSSIENLPTPTGTRISCQVQKLPLELEPGHTFLFGMCVDLSEGCRQKTDLENSQDALKNADRLLQRWQAQDTAVYNCLRDIFEIADFDQAMLSILRRTGELLEADSCSVYQSAPGRDVFTRSVSWIPDALGDSRRKPLELNREEYPECFRVLQTEQFLALDLLRTPPERRTPAQQELAGYMTIHGINVWYAAVIRVENNDWGCLVAWITNPERSFGMAEARMLNAGARILEVLLQHHARQQQLQLLRRPQNRLFHRLEIPLLIFDAEGRIHDANRAATHLFDRTQEQMKRLDASGLFPESSEAVAAAIRTAVAGTETQSELRCGHRTIRICFQPFETGEEERRAVGSILDLTDVRHHQEELQRAIAEAGAANAAKSFFLATMSHEIRTPLNAVIGFSELLQSQHLSPVEQREYLKSIHLAGTALLQLINDILDLSKIESGQLQIHPEQTDFSRLCEETRMLFLGQAQAKGLGLELDLPVDLPLVTLDAQRIRQVLLNLVGNAMKFTDHGKVVLSVKFTRMANGRGTLVFAITDTGGGIAADQQEKIFDPYVQEFDRQKGRLQGTGLGLPISRRLITKMGGTLTLRSSPGSGSCFTVTLPELEFRRFASFSPSRKLESTIHTGGIGDPEEIPIMVVDDVPMNLKVLAAMLKRLHRSTVCCDGGGEALEVLQTLRPQLILTDLWMPEMTGEEMAFKLKSDPTLRDIPIVAVTADSQLKISEESPFDEVLYKPLTLEKLRPVLRKFS